MREGCKIIFKPWNQWNFMFFVVFCSLPFTRTVDHSCAMFLPTHVSRPSYCLKSPYRHLLLENLTVPLSGKSVGFQERIFLGFADCGILYFPDIFPWHFFGYGVCPFVLLYSTKIVCQRGYIISAWRSLFLPCHTFMLSCEQKSEQN